MTTAFSLIIEEPLVLWRMAWSFLTEGDLPRVGGLKLGSRVWGLPGIEGPWEVNLDAGAGSMASQSDPGTTSPSSLQFSVSSKAKPRGVPSESSRPTFKVRFGLSDTESHSPAVSKLYLFPLEGPTSPQGYRYHSHPRLCGVNPRTHQAPDHPHISVKTPPQGISATDGICLW